MTDIYKRLGQRVRSERTNLGWTQEELADRAGMHPSYIGQVERIEKKISLAAADRIAAALGIDVAVLLSSSERLPSLTEWESRIGGLLRDKKPSEQEILYKTLRELARSIRAARTVRQ